MNASSSRFPSTIGRFQIEALIGSGGMGEVYKATDPTLQRTVAVKVVRPDINSPDSLERLYREAQACARLQHPNIVTVHEAGETDGVVYIAMEFLKGEDLAVALRRGELSFEAKIQALIQILRALQHAHAEDVIHRDIKPSNVHRQPDGSVKLMDFGLARMTSVDTLTASGAMMGTLHYASPEQIRGEPVDQRTDIYSTGALAYEMFSGRPPFQGDNDSAAAIVLRVLSEVPRPIDTLWSRRFPEIERIVARAMAKSPADRYQSAAEMHGALSAFFETSRDAIAAATTDDDPHTWQSTTLGGSDTAGLSAEARRLNGAKADAISAAGRGGRGFRRLLTAAALVLAVTAATAMIVSQQVRPSWQAQEPDTVQPLQDAGGASSVPGTDSAPREPAPTATPPRPLPQPPASGAADAPAPPTTSAKQLFYADTAREAATSNPATMPVGLRYRIVKQVSPGNEIDVDPETTFRSGDRVRFAFESNIDGYLYVVQEGSSGRWTLLFPNPQLNGGSNAIRRMQQYLVPSEGWFEFDDIPGTERAFVFLTKEPFDRLPGFNQPVSRTETVSSDVVDDLDRSIRSRDLKWVTEKERSGPPAAGAKPTAATYVVNRDEVGQAVAAVIELRHGQ